MPNFLTSQKQIATHRLESKRVTNEAIQVAKQFRAKAKAQWDGWHVLLIERDMELPLKDIGLGMMGADAGPPGNKRMRLVAREAAEFKKYVDALRNEFRPLTNGLRAKLADLKASVAASREFVGSPQSYLQGLDIGSDKRARYVAELAGAGPNMIKAMAFKARADKDRDLAAALLIANDRLPKESKPFRSQDFAAEFVGDEVKSLNAELTRIERVLAVSELGLARSLAEPLPSSTGTVALKYRKYEQPEGLEADDSFDQIPEIWKNVNATDVIPDPMQEIRGHVAGDTVALGKITAGLQARAAA